MLRKYPACYYSFHGATLIQAHFPTQVKEHEERCRKERKTYAELQEEEARQQRRRAEIACAFTARLKESSQKDLRSASRDTGGRRGRRGSSRKASQDKGGAGAASQLPVQLEAPPHSPKSPSRSRKASQDEEGGAETASQLPQTARSASAFSQVSIAERWKKASQDKESGFSRLVGFSIQI